MNAEKALVAKAGRLDRVKRQTANRKRIQENREKEITDFSSELDAKTQNN